MNAPSPVKSYSASPPIAILGVPFDNVTTAETITLIERMIASRRPHYLVTANVDFLVQAQEDIELRRILFDAHLVLCDGTPLVWASRLLGNPLPERVAGSDLVPLLIRLAAEKKYRVFLLGGTPESTAAAMEKLKAAHPGLLVEGYSPPFNKLLEMDHEEINRRIHEAAPDFLFVSFGCPKQEKWMAMHYQSLGVPVCAGVGGTIDFLAGQLKRAPVWMQRTGTEWIFRMLQEPRRLVGRYVKDLRVFGGTIIAQWWQLQFRHNRTRPAQQVSAPIQTEESWQWIKMPERLDMLAVRNDALLMDTVLADGRHCLLEMANVEFIDSTGVGMLIRLQKKVRATGRQLVLLAPSGAVIQALSLMKLKDFFTAASDFAAAQKLIQARTLEQKPVVPANTSHTDKSLVWRGEITAANAEDVWRSTEAQITAAPAGSRLTINLSDVRFLDSSGLGIMIRVKKLGKSQNVMLVYANVQPAVRNVIRMARMEAFLLGEAA